MPENTKATKPGWRLRLRRWIWRGVYAFALFWLAYGCFLLLGFIPVNRDYQVPPEDDRVRIFIRSSDIHTDFVMPISSSESGVDWGGLFPPEHFHAPSRGAQYVAVGLAGR